MNPSRVTHSLLLAALLPLGCGNGALAPGGGGTLVKSSQPRASATTVPAADLTQQSADDATFALDLYARLSAGSGNLFFSPYSISSALAMTWTGAEGDTASAMAGALDFSLPVARADAAFNAIDQALATRAQSGTSDKGGPFQLNVVNALWGQKGFQFEMPFLDTLAEDFGAGVRLEDFATAPDASRLDINAWISNNTAGKIPNLLGPGTVTNDTRLVLTNAVYFNGSWATAFDVKQTAAATFHALDGSSPSVPTMHGSITTNWAQGKGWQSVELPYSNPALTMTLIVPDSGSFATVEGQLDQAFFASVVAAEKPALVTLALPKFSIDTQVDLASVLGALGMGVAFTPSADFSGIDGAHDLSISGVIHEATVDVDEAGTEAAAATAVVVGIDALEGPVVTLSIDRPFLIVLRDVPTGALLFVGRLVTAAE